MTGKRVFVRKKQEFDIISKKLLENINANFHLSIKGLTVYSIYDLFNIDNEKLELITKKVLSESVTDEVLESVDTKDKVYIAHELLKGQFDIRAYNARQCATMITTIDDDFSIESGELIVFHEKINNSDLLKIKKYLINPAERREKNLSILEKEDSGKPTKVPDTLDFKNYNDDKILQTKKELGINLDLPTLKFIQAYYKENNYDCNPTELYLFDTYWSDHCRHTTFSTILDEVNFDNSTNSSYIKKSYEKYLAQREEINHTKPITLMDLAIFNARYLKKKGGLTKVEESEEINACSVYTDVNGEDYLVMFKNETHNHPTEIEPFGGASTCLGGAIRDPLSGRSYVYQGIRVSGASDPTADIKDTLENKLPQIKICREAADGFSSYGNQIGMATTFVKEIYHPSYVAKRLELGAVVGFAKAENVVRESPIAEDLILLLGGKTGKDGIGGASGSSLSHDEKSLDTSLAQIQKGNPIEERKLQRLFKNPEFSKYIKKCNDFGAGGVSVAIGELADGVTINLDKIKLKTDNLNVCQIAISESQERMAIVIDKSKVDRVLELCLEENVEATVVGKVTDDRKLVMKYNDEIVATINRDFLDTNGLTYHQNVSVKDKKYKEYDREHFRKLNSYSQKGLIEIFDSSVGCSTVLQPLGGKNQITTQLGSVQQLPTPDITNIASVVTYGFEPTVSEKSPYFAGLYAIIEAVAKQIALGSSLDEVYISMQEYFPSLTQDEEKWGLVLSALLGAFEAMSELGLGAIGGKDSMSGTFSDIDVISTIVAFAFSTSDKNKIISREFKKEDSYIYFLPMKVDENGFPCFETLKENFNLITELRKKANAISTVSDGINETLLEMSYGNDIGFELNTKFNLTDRFFGSFVIESNTEIDNPNLHLIGKTKSKLSLIQLTSKNVHLKGLYKVYPFTNVEKDVVDYSKTCDTKKYYPTKVENPKALILCFAGTNSEIDMERSFRLAGAETEVVVINSNNNETLNNSVTKVVEKLQTSHMLVLPGGFSFSDEPDGSAKFIVNFLKNENVKNAIHKFLEDKKLILGICNGFQALIKSGLVPYGKVIDVEETAPTLYYNDNLKHISKMVKTVVASNSSPWLQDVDMSKEYILPISHGEGKLVCNESTLKYLQENDLIATRYSQNSTTCENPNGSTFEIEGITSICGQVLGKMAHNERSRNDLFINVNGEKEQNIFKSSVNYFTGGAK
ncbi:MAG: phosphoribosylformylglycinamidine synthase [Lachnospirales bacterium]